MGIQSEIKSKLADLLRSDDLTNWETAFSLYHTAGYSSSDAWRWFLYGLFYQSGLTDVNFSGYFYNNEWLQDNNAEVYFDFGGVSLCIESVQAGGLEDNDVVNVEVNIGGVVYSMDNYLFPCYRNFEKMLPQRKPYTDYKQTIRDMRAYFYVMLVEVMDKYKGLVFDLYSLPY